MIPDELDLTIAIACIVRVCLDAQREILLTHPNTQHVQSPASQPSLDHLSVILGHFVRRGLDTYGDIGQLVFQHSVDVIELFLRGQEPYGAGGDVATPIVADDGQISHVGVSSQFPDVLVPTRHFLRALRMRAGTDLNN